MTIDPGIAGAIGAGIPLIAWEIARGISRKIGKAKTIPERMARLESVVEQIAAEMPVQTKALKASLEAHQGNCNGNVDAAIGEINKIEDQREKFYRDQALRGAQL